MRMEEKETLMYSIDKQILEGKKKYPGKGYAGYAIVNAVGDIDVIFYYDSESKWNALTQFEILMGKKLTKKIFDNFSFIANGYTKNQMGFTLSEI